MIVTQRPGAIEFASNMPDYIIDADATISFEVKIGNQTILSEEYSPDAEFKVRIRKLGRFCRKALWGIWPNGNDNVTYQNNIGATFGFYIDGVLDAESFVIFSRVAACKYDFSSPVMLSSVNSKVIRSGIPEYLSFFLKNGQSLEVSCTTVDGVAIKQNFYTHSLENAVCTFRCDLERIGMLFGDAVFNSFRVGNMTYYIDSTSYAERFIFRFKNMYDCPEIICATGFMKLKGDSDSEISFMNGIERKFIINRKDEYTVNSGVIFRQSDYKLWHDFLNCQEASVFVDGTWYDIVITQQNYERDYRKNILKAVEFSFRLADPENSGVI